MRQHPPGIELVAGMPVLAIPPSVASLRHEIPPMVTEHLSRYDDSSSTESQRTRTNTDNDCHGFLIDPFAKASARDSGGPHSAVYARQARDRSWWMKPCDRKRQQSLGDTLFEVEVNRVLRQDAGVLEHDRADRSFTAPWTLRLRANASVDDSSRCCSPTAKSPEAVPVGRGNTVPAQRMKEGGKVARIIEATRGVVRPALLLEDKAIDFVVPEHIERLPLSVVISAGERNAGGLARHWRGYYVLHQSAAQAHED